VTRAEVNVDEASPGAAAVLVSVEELFTTACDVDCCAGVGIGNVKTGCVNAAVEALVTAP
jgi:hypothetical protein